jgi:hypothetical protein
MVQDFIFLKRMQSLLHILDLFAVQLSIYLGTGQKGTP